MTTRLPVEGIHYRPVGRLKELDAAMRLRFKTIDRTVLPYHDYAHTFGPGGVVDSVYQLAYAEQLRKRPAELLLAAAMFHDAGLIEDYHRQGHEERGALLAQNVLPSYGFTTRAIASVMRLVRATNLLHVPRRHDEALIRDADVANLGSPDFWECNQALMREEGCLDPFVWAQKSVLFLRSHRFHTETARRLWDDAKCANLARLMKEL